MKQEEIPQHLLKGWERISATDELQRIGQLHERRPAMSMVSAVRQARLMFYGNPHLQGLEPTECRVHPDHLKELPAAGVDGLLIAGDETVKLEHVFVCCPDPEAIYA